MENNFKFGPLWAEVNLNNLIHNVKSIREIVNKDTMVMGVIKANAYGHGAVKFAEVLLENGVDKLAVATIREAIELRKANIKADILVLGFTQISDLDLVLKYDITQTIYNINQAKVLSDIAKERGKTSKIHIKVDSGMSRIGYRSLEDVEEILEIGKLENIFVEGMFTHFATADSTDKTFTREQFKRYKEIVDKVEEKGLNISIKHVSNSAAIMDLPEYNLNMVRAGVILYGLYPSDEVMKENLELKPVMTLKTKVSHIKTVDENTGIGYGQTFTTDGVAKIGTMPIGYADGYSRLLSNLGEVGINGERAEIVGRICMDQTMLNLTGIDVQLEDEVVIFNDGEYGYPTIDELAQKLKTINYELATLIGRRISRVYTFDGKVVDVVDYLID